MINKKDMESTAKQYELFWRKENHQRPVFFITAPEALHYPPPASLHATLKERWCDVSYQIKKVRHQMQHTFYGVDAYPYIGPDLGPDILGAITGCDLSFGETTSWAVHCVEDWDTTAPLTLLPDNPWYQLISQLTDAFVEDARSGDYLVGIPDFHPGLDGLASLRGPQDLCFDLYDEPDVIHQRLNEMFHIYTRVIDTFFNKTTQYQTGTTHWMNPWHPGRFYNVSCDMMCMLSPDMFQEFVLPQVLLESQLFDACMFHLDGPEALKHLDALLKVPTITGIQWQYGSGNPTAAHWIDILIKIQKAGKNIIVDIVSEDLDEMMRQLEPEGLMMNAYCQSKEEAVYLQRKIENFYGVRFD